MPYFVDWSSSILTGNGFFILFLVFDYILQQFNPDSGLKFGFARYWLGVILNSFCNIFNSLGFDALFAFEQ